MWRTLYVEVRHHVAEFLDMSGQVRAGGDVLQPAEALAGEAGGDTGKLAHGTQLGKPLTREAEGTDVLRLVGRGWRGRLEALL